MTWQRGPIDFPDPYDVALTIVRDAIAASVDDDIVGVTAVRTMPTPRPAAVIQLRIDGGSAGQVQGLVDASLLTYRTWGADARQARILAEFVRGALLNAPQSVAGAKVSRVVDRLRPIDVTDPDDESVTTYFGRVDLWLRT